jgi:hypothetical protein
MSGQHTAVVGNFIEGWSQPHLKKLYPCAFLLVGTCEHLSNWIQIKRFSTLVRHCLGICGPWGRFTYLNSCPYSFMVCFVSEFDPMRWLKPIHALLSVVRVLQMRLDKSSTIRKLQTLGVMMRATGLELGWKCTPSGLEHCPSAFAFWNSLYQFRPQDRPKANLECWSTDYGIWSW